LFLGICRANRMEMANYKMKVCGFMAPPYFLKNWYINDDYSLGRSQILLLIWIFFWIIPCHRLPTIRISLNRQTHTPSGELVKEWRPALNINKQTNIVDLNVFQTICVNKLCFMAREYVPALSLALMCSHVTGKMCLQILDHIFHYFLASSTDTEI
jgi:hypothetical protein